VGRRGPQPLDSETLRRRGSTRWKARARQEAAAAEQVEAKELNPIEPPEWLSDKAKDVWRTADRFLLSNYPKVDEPTLAAFCQTYADLVEAHALVRRDGLVISDERGARKHPATTIINANRTALVKLGATLGFSPASRQSLGWVLDDA